MIGNGYCHSHVFSFGRPGAVAMLPGRASGPGSLDAQNSSVIWGHTESSD